MNLLLDLGNSRLKWACSKNNQLQIGQTLSHSEITPQKLRVLWQDLQPEKMGISCVGKAELLSVITTMAVELWGGINLYSAETQKEAFGVKNGYLQSETLGIDRWLAVCAAKQKTNLPVCVVDCGTAITIDVLNENGVHQGGVICAGLNLMKTALALNTAALPFVNCAKKRGLGIETEAAIYNGTLFAACGLIEKIMNQQPSNTLLFLTGGDAKIISEQLNHAFSLETNLVLDGLNQFLNSK